MTATPPHRLRPPEPSAAARPVDQLLAENERTRVVRHWQGNGVSVIRKLARGPDALTRLRHEGAVLQRLAHVVGVAKLAPGDHPDSLLTLRDDGGQTLHSALQSGPLPLDQSLSVARQLTETLTEMHRAGVLHKDINPANIVLSEPDARPVLIDFNIASTFSDERPSFGHERHIAGTLAYMAPEQTGRTGRTIDQRSDLYALGATLYEMLTGQSPFQGDDLLSTIHQQLTVIPKAPLLLQPQVPQGLSDIVMRLLEKEPDRRYQSAEGLAHDLARVAELIGAGQNTTFPLGERDFPRKLSAPSRLVGRASEINTLRQAFSQATQSAGQVLLVAGSPGVGKSSLIDELRPWVTAQHGWYAAGKFDQYQQETAGGALVQALRQLGRLLLSEPEDELLKLRARLLANLGGTAGVMAVSLPEFARIMDVPPNTTVEDPVQAAYRVRQGTVDLLRSVASPERPLVLVIDDLQWAPAASMAIIEAVQADGQLPGVLLVGAYRHTEVDATHPLSALLTRWSQQARRPMQLSLNNLPPASVAELLQEMLRLPRAEAARLAQAVGMRTAGNPYDTVELVNALRREGALTLGEAGWHWDAQAIRQFVGQSEVIDLLSARIGRLPKPSQNLLDILACLGSETRLSTLCAASGLATETAEAHLQPALEDGLIQRDSSTDAVVIRFRHDRVQQAAYTRLEPAYQQLLHLTLARRLAEHSSLAMSAAQQYLPTLGSVVRSDEQRRVAELLRLIAQRASVINYPLSVRCLRAALELIDRVIADEALDADRALWGELMCELHTAVYGLGHMEDTDAVYEAIVGSSASASVITRASLIQIHSLINRTQTRDALALGMKRLSEMGLTPPDDIKGDIKKGMAEFIAWAQEINADTPVDTPENTDRAARAMAKLLRSTQVAAFFCDQVTHTWLVLQSLRLWRRHGPSKASVASMCSAPLLLSYDIRLARPAYEAARHILRVGETRGYEPATSWARHLFALSAAPWFEPIDECVPQELRAREGLLHEGDLQSASFTYYGSCAFLLDCGQTLEAFATEIDGAIAFERRSGSTIASHATLSYQQLLRALRGQTRTPGSFSDTEVDEDTIAPKRRTPTLAAATYHALRALSAALFGDAPKLIEHAAAALPTLVAIPAFYPQTHIHLVNGLALLEQLRALPDDAEAEARAALFEQFERCLAWFTERARHAPSNFLALQRLLEAEHAWVRGEAWDAATLYNQAILAIPVRGRPWHTAYITERAGLFHLQCGLESSGRMLLADARQLYADWGASGKARQMAQTHAFLRNRAHHGRRTGTTQSPRRSTIVAAEVVDMHAILRASQLLSSETRLERLTDRLNQLLGEMTGAAKVTLVVRSEDRHWFIAPTQTDSRAGEIGLNSPAFGEHLPLSAFRYVERTQDHLVVPDAKRDDRFAQDPYIAPLPHCSLLLTPILRNGELRAVLILENNLSRGAFSDDRLDAVSLIAGQLAVSIENAQLYGSLERKVAQRTEALAEANHRLEQLSVTDPLTALFNRRRFTETIELEWKRALRSRSPIGLLMIDIDQFKRFNDHYGHQGGDICLRRVAQLLSSGLHRATDFLARYGGEEFVVVLPATDLPGTLIVAERLRLLVAHAKEPHADSDHGIVTISQGATAFTPEPTGSWQAHLEAADQALYLAKERGRNQVASNAAGGA